jgi:hypothetical protein
MRSGGHGGERPAGWRAGRASYQPEQVSLISTMFLINATKVLPWFYFHPAIPSVGPLTEGLKLIQI